MVRNAARRLHALGENNPQIIETLTNHLNDLHLNVRQTIAEILINLNQAHEQVQQCLIANISAPELAIRNRAFEQLKRLGCLFSFNVRSAYQQIIHHPNESIRQQALEILIVLKEISESILQLLLEHTSSENIQIASRTRNLLIALGKKDGKVIQFLTTALKNNTTKYYLQAFRILQVILGIKATADDGSHQALQVIPGSVSPGTHFIIRTEGIMTTHSAFAEMLLIRNLKTGSSSGARWLIQHGASINQRDDNGNTALHHAAANGQISIAQWLLQYGASIKETNFQGLTALHAAANNGQLPMVQWLLQNGSAIKECDKHGRTALIHAASANHIPVVQWLLQNAASLNEVSQYGDTVLLLIIIHNFNIGFVEWLLQNGASLKEMDNEGTTVILRAALWSHSKTVEWLLKKLAQDPANRKHDYADFYQAAWRSELVTVQHYLNTGMNQFSARHQPGSTALLLAAAAGHLNVVQFLLNNIKSEKDKYSNCNAALLWAAANGKLPVVTWLIKEAKASLSSKTIYGDTPLILSVFRGHFTTAHFLLEQGSDIFVKNRVGNDAITLAKIYNYVPLIGLLQSYFANHKTTAPNILANSDAKTEQKSTNIPEHAISLPLALVQSPDTIFFELLQHHEAEIRYGAAFLLTELHQHSPLVVNMIREALQAADGQIRDYVYNLLKKQQQLHTPEVIETLMQMLQHKRANIRQEALEVLMELNHTTRSTALEVLQQNLVAPEAGMAERVIRQLWQLASVEPQALKLLQKILADANSKPEARQFVVVTLASLDKFDAHCLQVLLQNLSCDNQWLRKNATDFLARLNKLSTEQVIKIYQHNLTHKNIEICQEAIQMLIHLQRHDENVLRILVEQLQGNTAISNMAQDLLVMLVNTQADKRVLPHLIAALTKDLERKLCQSILKTLKNILTIGEFEGNMTTLQQAIQVGHSVLIEWLLQNGAFVKGMDEKTHEALLGAAKQNHITIVQTFANKRPKKISLNQKPFQQPPKIFFTLLEDKEITIRQDAAIILSKLQINDSRVIRVLLDALSASNNETQEEAYDALEQLKKLDDPDVLKELKNNLQHSHVHVRQFAVEKLLELEAIEIPLAINVLVKNLAVSDPSIYQDVIQQLVELEMADTPKVIEAHAKNLLHKNEEIRQIAADALINLKIINEKIISVLQTNAGFGNPAIRPFAMEILNKAEDFNQRVISKSIQELSIFRPTVNAGKVAKRIVVPIKMKPFFVAAEQKGKTSLETVLTIIQDYLFVGSAHSNNPKPGS